MNLPINVPSPADIVPIVIIRILPEDAAVDLNTLPMRMP